MIGQEPICMKCKHLFKDNGEEGFRCAAFPQGIPELFIEAVADHDEPYPGDNGIQFEPKDSAPK